MDTSVSEVNEVWVGLETRVGNAGVEGEVLREGAWESFSRFGWWTEKVNLGIVRDEGRMGEVCGRFDEGDVGESSVRLRLRVLVVVGVGLVLARTLRAESLAASCCVLMIRGSFVATGVC